MNEVLPSFDVSSALSATWLSLLRLMLSNDVERNPGPVTGEFLCCMKLQVFYFDEVFI